MPKDPSRLPPLDLLATFDSASRHLSFTKAAAERFVTQSAVSRQIRALEDDLGVPLFTRRHRSLALTDDGARLHEAVTRALSEVRAVVSRIRSPKRRDVISLTTTPGLASLWLIPRLAGFLRDNPGSDVRIDASLERRDLRGEGFDVALRYARAGSVDGVQLFREVTAPVCSPALARDRARPLRTPADLRHHTLLQVAVPAGSAVPLEWAPWLQAVGLGDLEPAATLTFNNYDDAIAAAIEGQGVALGRRPLVDRLLRTRQLVEPFRRDPVASERAYFLVVSTEARNRPAVQNLAEWLVERAREPAG
jgi:DNA-binding transcriptional LysR family regulator